MEQLINTILKEEEQDFQPGGLETFAMHAARIRNEIQEALTQIQHKLEQGYDGMRKAFEEQGWNFPSLHLTMDEGKRQVQGVSKEDLVHFYQVAYQFTQDKDFEKGRDAFFLLVTIAPQVADFWLGLAICESQLQNEEPALKAALCAIECDPSKVDNYLQAIYLYRRAKEEDKAKALCQQGIDYGVGHSREPWSKTLVETLKEQF